MPGASPSKNLSVSLLVIAEMAGMSLWFASAAVLPDMAREAAISPDRQALLSSGVQAGFVLGALVSSIGGIADRYDPRRVFAISAILAALVNMTLLVLPLGGNLAILARFVTGALLAGVYPVGMKIVVGWGSRDRGFLVGLLVGALTLGNGLPYLASFLGGADWRSTIVAVSLLAGAGGLIVLGVGLGPHHARAPTLRPGAIRLAWTDRGSAPPISAISAICGNSSLSGRGSARHPPSPTGPRSKSPRPKVSASSPPFSPLRSARWPA